MLEKWPKDKVPPDAITEWEAIDGLRPMYPLSEGEPIRKEKLVDPDNVRGGTDGIRKGYRGLPVKVTYEMTSGLLQPGDMVDVLVVFRQGGGISRTVVKTILQNVPIYAVNEKIIRETSVDGKVVNARTVTLEVTPEQAQNVTLAMKMGDLSLSLRSPGDDESFDYDGTGISQLLGDPGDVVEPPPRVAKQVADDFMRFAQREGRPSLPEMGSGKPKQTMDVIEPSGSRTFEIFPDGSMPREIMPFGSEVEALDAMAEEEDPEPELDEVLDEEDDGGLEALGEYGLPGSDKAGQ
jgi:pilus assembly protein CpaB